MEQNQKIPKIYRFGEFQIDTAEETLRRSDEKISINRRTFQVLRLLVERQGEIVTKQEFFDSVWTDTFVEDNSLTVAMTTLRKALGDDPKEPTFIENLPRKGYRFIAKVTADREIGAVPKAATSAPDLSKLSRARWPRITTAVLVLVTILGVFGFTFLKGYPRIGSSPQMSEIDSIAVMPFENQVAETQFLSDGLTESLMTKLADLPNLRVINRSSVFKYQDQKKDIRTIQEDLNVRAVVTGELIQEGDNLEMIVRFADRQSGEGVWEKRYSGRLADIFTLQQNIARDVSLKLRSERTAENNKKRETDSPDAFSYISRGFIFGIGDRTQIITRRWTYFDKRSL